MDEKTKKPSYAPAEFRFRMQECYILAERDGDEERAHENADLIIIELLRSLGYEEGCDVFEEMPKWYS